MHVYWLLLAKEAKRCFAVWPALISYLAGHIHCMITVRNCMCGGKLWRAMTEKAGGGGKTENCKDDGRLHVIAECCGWPILIAAKLLLVIVE